MKEDQLSTDYICMYYEHQYDRMSKLEEQALTVTNIVVAMSVVAFTFGFDSTLGLTMMTGIGLPFVIVVANAFAILHLRRAHSYMRTHRLRAKRVLETYAKELHELDKTTVTPYRTGPLGTRRIHVLLHGLLIAAALIPMVVFLVDII